MMPTRRPFSVIGTPESRQSSLENRLAQYLAASELSVRSIDAEREKIKELIADISHQTRTPLSNILLYTELLEEEPLGEAAQDSVKKLRQQSEKLQFLMDALVKLSRLETGVFVLHPIRQPLTELVVDGMESYREKAAAKGLAIAFSGTKKAEEGAPVYAYFDKKWSMEALGNILDNAIKYTNTGGITIKLCSYELFACVEVTDTGIGIGEEEHAAVFGRFYRGNAVEVLSRRSFLSACSFVGMHTGAFFYNAFIVFASLSFVYLFRRRAFWRIIISGFWVLLGIINGCILSNRVTPFGFTDLKCINDLFAMNNTNYFTAEEATIVVIGLGLFLLFCVALFIKGPRYQGKTHKIVVVGAIVSVLFVGLPVTTSAAQNANVVASYFSNIAQGYENYGFIYGFSSSVVDRGMSKPDDYSEQKIASIEKNVNDTKKETTVTKKNAPNIICILLESFCDPDEIKFLNYNQDPIPTIHNLEKNYTSGYLTVPVVGAGTANTEFEVLSGMSMQYFGTGEYPYKTILKKTDCESTAADLASIGYGTHAVHNNGGNFYSRVNAFSMMGFDTFTSKELMNIQSYTPNGSWATDDILVPETIKTLDSTPNQPDHR